MKLYDEWNSKFTRENAANGEAFITQYYQKEKEAYAAILAAKTNEIKMTVADFAKKFKMEEYEVTGFVEGINTSLSAEIDPATLESTTEISLSIKWDALYVNMHKAKAHWLFNLPEWDGIYSLEERDAIMKEYHKSVQAVCTKVGRNAPCPCGSGKKFKNCCGKNA